MKSASFDADVVLVAVANANVEVSVPHSLGRVPGDAFVLWRDKGATIRRGTTPWTDTHIFIMSSTARAGFRLMLVGGGDVAGEEIVAARTRAVAMSVMTDSDSAGPSIWVDALTKTAYFFGIVPPDYDSGDITLKVFRLSGATSGTAVMQREIARLRSGASFSAGVIENFGDVGFNYVAANPEVFQVSSITVAAANFQIGDMIRLGVRRLGGNGSDNLASTVFSGGASMEYTSAA